VTAFYLTVWQFDNVYVFYRWYIPGTWKWTCFGVGWLRRQGVRVREIRKRRQSEWKTLKPGNDTAKYCRKCWREYYGV